MAALLLISSGTSLQQSTQATCRVQCQLFDAAAALRCLRIRERQSGTLSTLLGCITQRKSGCTRGLHHLQLSCYILCLPFGLSRGVGPDWVRLSDELHIPYSSSLLGSWTQYGGGDVQSLLRMCSSLAAFRGQADLLHIAGQKLHIAGQNLLHIAGQIFSPYCWSKTPYRWTKSLEHSHVWPISAVAGAGGQPPMSAQSRARSQSPQAARNGLGPAAKHGFVPG